MHNIIRGKNHYYVARNKGFGVMQNTSQEVRVMQNMSQEVMGHAQHGTRGKGQA